MKHILTLIFVVLSIQILSAQNKTYAPGNLGFSKTLPTVAIIPFEDKMFLSDINKEIGNRTGLSINEIEDAFRDGMIQSIVNLGSDSYNFIDPNDLEEEEMHRLLGGIYSCISYDYKKVVPLKEEEKSKAKELIEKIEKKENPDQKDRGVYLENGEIQEWYDKKERFMDAEIHNQKLFDEVVATNSLDYVLKINELDIQVMRDVNRDVGQTWDRRVKIHFTIFDKEGNKNFGSAVYQIYDGNEKDIYSIIRKNFRGPCSQIVAKIGADTNEISDKPEKTKNEKRKNNSEEKPAKKFIIEETEDSDDDF